MQRKTVTVLFCDISGSTALGESVDPEALRGLLARYFEQMKRIVERHGGTVEKFIGDAVMAVFGVPVAHEDDALRAVRAASEMREALPGLGIRARIGVNTGEVVTGTEERLATGDAVNVAARLEQAAKPDEILIGEATLALVDAAADVERVEPLKLKGKTEAVAAYRLVRVREAPERRHETRFVGREREIGLLRDSWDRALAERRCELVTIVGDAGVGKSRLVAELVRSLGTTVARGRCLPYGEGITYWPVIEVLKELRVLPADEVAAGAIRSLLGETVETSTAEEIAWAVRKTFEQAAGERPLVVVFDDIQWGEETFLDLVEHVALLSSGKAILLLCTARPELTERRPSWRVILSLEPLGKQAIEELIPAQLAGELREKISRASGGNPLFVGEMLAMAEGSQDRVVVPPSLQALLAARLDQLDAPERGVLERGAVEGEIFHRGAVQALAPEEQQVTPRLAALVRKQLIRPDPPQIPGEDGFRFRHLLIRDAAYSALPKAARAELHQRFAAWLEKHDAVAELDEIAGYHLEQASRYRAELGWPADDDLRSAARGRLATAGRRAYVRGDYRAAISLLQRAAALMPPAAVDLTLEMALADALFESGRGAEALERAGSVSARAAALGDRVGELTARVQEGRFRTFFEPEGATDKLAALLDEALPLFDAAGDELPLYIGYYALGQVAGMRMHMDAMLEALDRAALHAERFGAPPVLMGWRSTGRVLGTTAVPETLKWLDEWQVREPSNALLRRDRAHCLAMLGEFDEARAILAEVRSELADRGGGIELGATAGQTCVDVELLADDPARAVATGEEGCRMLDALGEHSLLSSAAAMLAQAYYALDRVADAEATAGRAAKLGASDDVFTQMLSRQVRAKVEARRGEHAEAERLAREAVALGEDTDMLSAQAGALADLGEVLSLAGRHAGAAEAFELAVARYERKGNVVMAERTKARLRRELDHRALGESSEDPS